MGFFCFLVIFESMSFESRFYKFLYELLFRKMVLHYVGIPSVR